MKADDRPRSLRGIRLLPEMPEFAVMQPAPNPLDDDVVPLLDSLQAAPSGIAGPGSGALRQRLFDRVARSAAASRPMFTVRLKSAALVSPAPGVLVRTLYQATRSPLRPGEPQRVSWIELASGARWSGAVAGGLDNELQRDWLVVRGSACIAGHEAGPLDYRVVPAGTPQCEVTTPDGATLYLREAPRPHQEVDLPTGVSPLGTDWADSANSADRADCADWADFAPGIRRRLLWARGREAAMLYHAQPGASVPRHGHGHDEECLMLQGDLFVDDVLLRAGDYQLAPAGTGHGGLFTDTGVLLYAHGDLDLDLVSEGPPA